MTKFLKIVAILAVLIGATSSVTTTSAQNNTSVPDCLDDDLPAVSLAGTQVVQAQQPIIIDHTCTDLSKIPDYWLEEAQKLAFHYAHTSHGSQIISGLTSLEGQDSKYAFDRFTAGSSPPSTLNCDAGSLCIYDGNPPETYITPEDYWSTQTGISRTIAVVNTGLFDYSMWSWCGQQSSNSEGTVQQYLDTISSFEAEYPDMRFILMTGHTDGGSATLTRNNDMVRQYATDNGMVLFDFADIESYDPAGNYYPNTNDSCSWCTDWCNTHPDDCTNLEPDCAHSHPFNCLRKGQAFWWMMAQLAGWSGPGETQKTASITTPVHGQTVAYTVVVQNLTAPLTATVHLTDVIPTGLLYVSGTLTATSGAASDAGVPTLTWTGVLTPTPVVTITYAVTVSAVAPQVISNTAVIAASGYQPLSSTVTIIANGYPVYLPAVFKKFVP